MTYSPIYFTQQFLAREYNKMEEISRIPCFKKPKEFCLVVTQARGLNRLTAVGHMCHFHILKHNDI